MSGRRQACTAQVDREHEIVRCWHFYGTGPASLMFSIQLVGARSRCIGQNMANKRQTHGLHSLMRRVNARGIRALDGRTVAVRTVMEWRTARLNDLGGEANVSTQKLAIVDACVRGKLFLDHIDTFLMLEPSLVNRKRKSLIPALRERQSLVDSMARLLC